MGTLTNTLRAPVTNFKGNKDALSLNWLWQNKPRVNLVTSTLFISQEVVHQNIYLETIDHIMKDQIFVRITKTL